MPKLAVDKKGSVTHTTYSHVAVAESPGDPGQ